MHSGAPNRPHWFREWCAFLLIPLFYAEIPILNHAFLSTARDEWVRSLETAVFPSNPASSFAAAAPWPALSEMLHFAYLCYYPIIYGPLLILYFQQRPEAFRATGFAVAATYYCCYCIYILCPVRGPWDLWQLSGAQPDGPPAGLPSGFSRLVRRWVPRFLLPSSRRRRSDRLRAANCRGSRRSSGC
jgi:hypothetical protein